MHTLTNIFDSLCIINPTLLLMRLLMLGICRAKLAMGWGGLCTGILLKQWETIRVGLKEIPLLQVTQIILFIAVRSNKATCTYLIRHSSVWAMVIVITSKWFQFNWTAVH